MVDPWKYEVRAFPPCCHVCSSAHQFLTAIGPPPDPQDCDPPLVLCDRACCGPDSVCNPSNGLCKPKPRPGPAPWPGNIWISYWTQQCTAPPGTGCTTDGSRLFRIQGDHFSQASVTVGIYRNNNLNDRVWETTIGAYDGEAVGASIFVDAPIVDCGSGGEPSFIIAKDLLSGRFSNRIDVRTGCWLL
jgi:hypothetical protein